MNATMDGPGAVEGQSIEDEASLGTLKPQIPSDGGQGNNMLRPYGYQREMVEESLKYPTSRPDNSSYRTIEGSLNAIAKTPKIHRAELLKHVFRPELIPILYPVCYADSSPKPQALENLSDLYFGLDIEQDPYVIKLRAESDGRHSPQLQKALMKGKTYCSEQIKSLYVKSTDIFVELGPWATHYYIHAVVDKFCSREEDLIPGMSALDDTEKEYLEKLLLSIRIPSLALLPLEGDSYLSGKVRRLLDFLESIDTTDFTGLIFVRTRATCAVLAYLLASHVRTKDNFRVSTFVGMSMSSSRKFNIGELVDVRNQKDTLDDLRSGQKNLVIATSVLEEGVDVSACNVVICFEKPPNLVSFIQRRGRARKAKSKYVLMFPENDQQVAVATYEDLEERMKEMYMDEMRQLQELEKLEATEKGHREFKIESTGYASLPSIFIVPEDEAFAAKTHSNSYHRGTGTMLINVEQRQDYS
ncbi:MAG: hypothetical protein Q9191_001707 [Dirinaria sp. TL-2023a]